jgi:Ca2+-transporting ATPase
MTLLGVLIMVLTTEVGFLQAWLNTTELTGGQWLVCLAMAGAFGIVVELDKLWQRRKETR